MKDHENGYPVWPGWETVRLIGRGSFGAVYEIRRTLFKHTESAALKVISLPQNDSDISAMLLDGYDNESIAETFQTHLQNIVDEYSLMRKLNGSANVVSCDDVQYFQHKDGIGWDIYIKMELLTPLMQVLPASIPEELVIRVGADLCRALVLCRKYDIVHRDIKPQNIFVSPNGDYKLGDFGIAKTMENTTGGTRIGTYKYMAPEVFNNQPYGPAADICSLGLTLYWMLNQRRMPFVPPPSTKLRAGMDEEAWMRRFRGEPLPPPAYGSDELKRIVLKACAFRPEDRYADAGEMLSELEALETKTRFLPAIHDDPAAAEEDGTVLLSDLSADGPATAVGTAVLDQDAAETALLREGPNNMITEDRTSDIREEPNDPRNSPAGIDRSCRDRSQKAGSSCSLREYIEKNCPRQKKLISLGAALVYLRCLHFSYIVFEANRLKNYIYPIDFYYFALLLPLAILVHVRKSKIISIALVVLSVLGAGLSYMSSMAALIFYLLCVAGSVLVFAAIRRADKEYRRIT